MSIRHPTIISAVAQHHHHQRSTLSLKRSLKISPRNIHFIRVTDFRGNVTEFVRAFKLLFEVFHEMKIHSVVVVDGFDPFTSQSKNSRDEDTGTCIESCNEFNFIYNLMHYSRIKLKLVKSYAF